MSGFFIYKSTAEVKKLAADAVDADKEGYTTHLLNLKISIQPAGPVFTALTPMGEVGKTYLGFTTRSGIQENVLIVTSGTLTVSGMRLRVNGVEEWSGPLGRTYRLTLTRTTK